MYKFDEKDAVRGSWWKPVAIGDSVQGTYIGKSEKADQYNAGEMQQIYELQLEDGSISYVGGKKSIDLQMKHITFGQIIMFKYINDMDTGKGNKFKNVQVYQNKEAVNAEWLQQNESILAEDAPEQGAQTAEEVAAEFGGKVIDEGNDNWTQDKQDGCVEGLKMAQRLINNNI